VIHRGDGASREKRAEGGAWGAVVRLGWLSDIHLNFLDPMGVLSFFSELDGHDVDAWLLCGDIGEADSVIPFLRGFEETLRAPTYFVLGNHDFYRGSLEQVRVDVAAWEARARQLVWLTRSPPQRIGRDVVVVGDDSWADGRLGNALGTPIELSDFFLIEELRDLPRRRLVQKLNELGDESAARLAPKLGEAAELSGDVVVLAHVPPFEGAAWHEDDISSSDWLPWFSCEAVGRVILECAGNHPETSFTVLCGHTHGSGTFEAAPNVSVLTARAEYGCPEVQRVLDFA